ncbi:hypothetical protein T4A_929 [Trichinella pseudospiralis]|uniref:Uncharacterized protein n=1 Tax=Trichinella pseudospiralis TaxID=6337 RepID=A0A0V1EII5_TRIPS|nr:hypothetical protein T4A_929 [Trichinella pseudospiralis]
MDLVSTIADRRYAVRVQWRSLSDEDHGITLFSVSDHGQLERMKKRMTRSRVEKKPNEGSSMGLYSADYRGNNSPLL